MQNQAPNIQPVFSPEIPILPNENILREAIFGNPQTISFFINIISEINPELAQKIQENPIPFLQTFGITVIRQGEKNLLVRSENVMNNPNSQIQSILNLFSPSERQTIERICQMGFDPLLVIQIFDACGRDETATINMLRSMN